MRISRSFLFFVAMVIPFAVSAQTLKPEQWRTYTSMRSAMDVALASDSVHVWAATGGGAFEADVRTAQVTLALRTTDGLSENDLTSVAADDSGNIYFGAGGGGFDVYHTATGTIDQLGSDIRSASYTNKAINGITISGDTIYLATGYGLSVYIVQSGGVGYFGYTATQIANLPTEDSLRQIISDGSYVYGAAHEGVVFAKAGSDLHNSHNWTLIPDTGGSVRALVNYHGKVYAGAENGLFEVSIGQGTLLPVSSAPQLAINRLIVAHDSLILLDESGTLHATSDLVTFSSQPINDSVQAITPDFRGGVVLALIGHGLSIPLNGSLVTNLFPAGPIANSLEYLSFSPASDALYVANGKSGFGVFHPSTDTWNDFLPRVSNQECIAIFYDSIRNVVWLGTYGSPLYRIQGLETDSPVWYPVDSTKIPAFSGSYIMTDGMMLDQSGNLVVTTWAGNSKGLSISRDGTNFQNYALLASGTEAWGPVTQDFSGNYWVGSRYGGILATSGLFWLRASDFSYGLIPGGSSGSLGTPTEGTEDINALITDQDGAVWCGTNAGIEIVSNPDAIDQPNPVFSIRSVPFVATQIINGIAVDGVGNKWIATNNGIFVVSPDGADSVARFTKENSPLVDDVVTAITIDPTRGEAYAGTPSGISRFSTIFKQGNPDYTHIRVYPNPVVQTGEGSPTVYIDGLVAGSTVQIFSLGGQLINTINGTALGSTVTWNGLDALGREVPSGMYLISATSPQTGNNGEAKVVIVRRP